MKRIILTALALALALASSAQTTEREAIPRGFKWLTIAGNCSVDIVRADECAIEYPKGTVVQNPDGSVTTPFTSVLSLEFFILDTLPRHYTLYYDRDTLSRLMLTDPEIVHRVRSQGVAVERLVAIQDLKVTPDTIAFEQTEVLKNEIIALDIPPMPDVTTYDRGTRLRLGYYFGFANWGSAPVGGLFGTRSEVYHADHGRMLTQVESALDFRLSYHWRATAGFNASMLFLGFNDRYLVPSGGGLALGESPVEGISLDNWKSELVIPQMALPVGIGWRDGTDRWECYLTLLPTWNYSSLKGTYSNFGLQHEAGNDEMHLTLCTPTGARRLSLQARAEVRFYGFSFYLQSYLTPLYRDPSGQRLFPVSVGLGAVL